MSNDENKTDECVLSHTCSTIDTTIMCHITDKTITKKIFDTYIIRMSYKNMYIGQCNCHSTQYKTILDILIPIYGVSIDIYNSLFKIRDFYGLNSILSLVGKHNIIVPEDVLRWVFIYSNGTINMFDDVNIIENCKYDASFDLMCTYISNVWACTNNCTRNLDIIIKKYENEKSKICYMNKHHKDTLVMHLINNNYDEKYIISIINKCEYRDMDIIICSMCKKLNYELLLYAICCKYELLDHHLKIIIEQENTKRKVNTVQYISEISTNFAHLLNTIYVRISPNVIEYANKYNILIDDRFVN